MLVTSGALAARGVDYRSAGQDAARIAHQVLVEGKKPFEIQIQHPACKHTFINKEILEALGLAVPQEIANDVIFVSQGA
jgi:ABC-type uncharacterized transport system substrate-binding protein